MSARKAKKVKIETRGPRKKITSGPFSLTAGQTVIFSFLVVIIVGATLLMLPFTQTETATPISFLDALFTATSAVCVTGLVVVVPAFQWNILGHTVIMLLIQIGGLSFITIFSYYLIQTGKKVTLKDRMLIQNAINQNSLGGLARMVLMVIRGTFICEGIGALILTAFFMTNDGMIWYKALYFGIFHAVSAFCNAGFDIIGDTNLIPYVGSVTVNLVVMSLIIFGGIGFTVWADVIQGIKKWVQRVFQKKIITHHHFHLHSKLALISTALLLVFGAVYFFIAESGNPQTLGNLSTKEKILASMFQSVTLRTAGFTTSFQAGLKGSSKFVSSILMLIGGSPGGTAGGMKTVTVAIIIASVWSVIKGRESIDVMNRNIPMKQLQKALAIVMMMLILAFGATGLLSITEIASTFKHDFLDIFFEVSSALGTVGISTGITPFLSSVGKVILIICMLLGRLGPISVTLVLSSGLSRNQDGIKYPEEEVLIG